MKDEVYKNQIVSNQESKLIEAYMETTNYAEAFDISGMQLNKEDIDKLDNMVEDGTITRKRCEELKNFKKRGVALSILRKPHVKAEMSRRIRARRVEDMATSDEVMYYFTQVMRGEIKDQFGLDAPLSERTRAAIELAKRTVDIDIEKEQNTAPNINIQLNWQRG